MTRRDRRGLALFAVLILVVLGTVVAAATLMAAESSAMASRSTGDGVDRMLRVRSALTLAAFGLGGQRDAVLGGGSPRVASRSLEALDDQRWRVVWTSDPDGSGRGRSGGRGPVELGVGTGVLGELAELRAGGGASAWEPEVRAVGVADPRVLLAAVVGNEAVGFASALGGAASRGEVARAMRRAGAESSEIESVLDAVRFGDGEFAIGRVDINRASAEAIAAAGVGIEDAEAIVRARSRRDAGERSSVYWPISSETIDDVDVCVAALDGLTTRTLQWMVRGAVVAGDDDAAWPLVGFRAVVDLSGERPRYVCVGFDVAGSTADVVVDSAVVVDSGLDVGFGGEADDPVLDRADEPVERAAETDDGLVDGGGSLDETGGRPMSRWIGVEP